VGPRTGLADVEKRKFLTLLGLELRPLGRPARSQSLYRLRYPMFIYCFIQVCIYLHCKYRPADAKLRHITDQHGTLDRNLTSRCVYSILKYDSRNACRTSVFHLVLIGLI
jgi:hypothetical protein